MKAKTLYSLTVLAMAAGGLVLTALLPVVLSWLGTSLLGMGMALSAGVRQTGPLRQATLHDPEDEREAVWRQQANRHAFGIVSVVAMLGIGGYGMWMLFMALGGHVPPALQLGTTLIAFAMFLFNLFLVLPTLLASWTLPDLVEDEPEGRLSFLKPRRRGLF